MSLSTAVAQPPQCRAPASFIMAFRRTELEAVDPVPIEARGRLVIVTRDLSRRLAGGKAAVDLWHAQMLARLAMSAQCPRLSLNAPDNASACQN